MCRIRNRRQSVARALAAWAQQNEKPRHSSSRHIYSRPIIHFIWGGVPSHTHVGHDPAPDGPSLAWPGPACVVAGGAAGARNKKNFILAGSILGLHGLKGYIKVKSFLENPKDLFNFDKYFINKISFSCLKLKFNKKSNPEPAKFTHHSALEITWTLVPTAILVLIGVFSLPILFKQLNIPEYDLTIKATGNQWYWSYEYPDKEIAFDSFMLAKEELSKYGYSDDEYLLATDNPVVVPVGSVVRMQVTGADVLHAWKIPAFGVHMDAVPGRLNETWYKVDKEGIYFGQCSELCGLNHSYMPIVVKAVSRDKYEKWLKEAEIEFSSIPKINSINLAKK